MCCTSLQDVSWRVPEKRLDFQVDFVHISKFINEESGC